MSDSHQRDNSNESFLLLPSRVNLVLTQSTAPSSEVLGAVFGLSQIVSCVARTISPWFIRYLHVLSDAKETDVSVKLLIRLREGAPKSVVGQLRVVRNVLYFGYQCMDHFSDSRCR